MKRYTEALADLDRSLEVNPSLDYTIIQRGLTLASMSLQSQIG